MPLAFLLDENLRGVLWRHLQRRNIGSTYPIDAVRVGDLHDLPLGSDDPAILLWAERENRILVSRDERTLAKYLAEHIAAGHHSPSILLARDVPLTEIVDFLVLAA